MTTNLLTSPDISGTLFYVSIQSYHHHDNTEVEYTHYENLNIFCQLFWQSVRQGTQPWSQWRSGRSTGTTVKVVPNSVAKNWLCDTWNTHLTTETTSIILRYSEGNVYAISSAQVQSNLWRHADSKLKGNATIRTKKEILIATKPNKKISCAINTWYNYRKMSLRFWEWMYNILAMTSFLGF